MSHFTELEMKELKYYFDGTRYNKIKDKDTKELGKDLNYKEEQSPIPILIINKK